MYGSAACASTRAALAICRSLYGAEQAPITLIPWLIGFTLPFSMLWGYFYAVNRRRLLTRLGDIDPITSREVGRILRTLFGH